MVVGHALLVRGASGTTGLLLVVAVLASGEHPNPQPSLDVTFCGLGTWRIDIVLARLLPTPVAQK